MIDSRNRDGGAPRVRDGLAVFAATLILYLATASPAVGPEDDGLFILAAKFNGIAHPPGYPLYTLLAHAFSWLPLGTMAYRIHSLSALLGAGAILVLWRLLQLLPGIGRLPAAAAALAFACSGTFWSQAIMAEVYALNALLILSLLGLCLHYHLAPDSRLHRRRVMALGLVMGLSLANHWPLTVLACSGMFIMLAPFWRRWPQDILTASPMLLLGLSPYLWMYLHSKSVPAISFYGPLEDFGDFLYVLSRKGYAGVDQSPSADWTDKAGFLGFLGQELVRQFTAAGFLLGAAGCVLQFRLWPKVIALGLCTSFLCSSVLLAVLLGFDNSHIWQAVFRVYPIIAYAILSIWLALGLGVALGWLRPRLQTASWRRWIPRGLALALVLAILSSHLPANNRHRFFFMQRYAETVLRTLPPKTVLFVHGDMSFGAIAYLQLVEQLRDDIVLLNPYGLVLSPRLFRPIELDNTYRRAVLRDYIAQLERPVCVVGDGIDDFGRQENWLFQCVRKNAPAQDNTFQIHPQHLVFLRQMLAEDLRQDSWASELRNLLLERAGRILAFVIHGDGGDAPNEALRSVYARVIATPYGRLGAAAQILEHLDPQLKRLGPAVEPLLDGFSGPPQWFGFKSYNARVPELRARMARARGQSAQALAGFTHSLRIWRSPQNPAAAQLLEYPEPQRRAAMPEELHRWLLGEAESIAGS